ncbi:hypothetical protein Gpo141_00003719 [Globisporangium polare]
MAIGKTFMKPASLRMHTPESDALGNKRSKHSGRQQPHQNHHSHSVLWLTHHGVAHMSSTTRASHENAHSRAATKRLIKSGLSREAAELKQRICATCPDTVVRFSFSSMKRLVTPPVSIPPHLASARARTTVVSGKHIPMTKAMWEKSKSLLQRRLPYRIDEQVWY